MAWEDGHETVFLPEELRGLCRCAQCQGEPDYPITGHERRKPL
ncbi:MAG: gamma-butyrobetaine hydroxylase-like domain-containing protein [Thermodesulfobacteriota bacterium]